VIEANMLQKKKDDFERREMIHLIKQKLISEKRNAIRKQEQQLKWLKLLNLMVMIDFIRRMYLREIITRKIRSKQLIVYRQAWDEWVLLHKARGPEKFIRMSWDSVMSCKYFAYQQKRLIKIHAKKIFVDFLKKTALLIGWNTKLIEYREESNQFIEIKE